MNTDTTTEHTEARADAIDAVHEHMARTAQQSALNAFATPSALDAALARKNPRPQVARSPSLFDVHEVMDVPNMAFDVGNISAHENFEELGGWNTDGARAAMEAVQTVVKQVITAREAYRSDPTMTEAAQVLAIDALHTSLSSKVLPKVDAARSALDKGIAAHAAELRKPVTEGARGPFAS